LIFVASRYWLLLGAVFFLALGLFYAPGLSVRLAIALVSAVLAGICLAYLLRRAPTSSSRRAIDATENPVGETFALGKLFEATMSGMREGLLVVDRDMRVVASNPEAHQLFILSEGKLDSKRLTELTRNRAIYSAFLEALKGEERSGIKVETHGPDRRIFDLRVVPLRTAGRKGTQGAIGVFFDITRLERLEHVRQEFLSNVSHELRTPLTAILAFVETLEAGGIEDQDRQRFLSIIRRNATRMHNLIDDILELSAIEAGNVQVKSEAVELHAVVSDVFISLAARAAARQVVLENEVDREALVFADARRLEQMLTNLVDNAIKFNRDGGRVTVRHENGSSDRVFVEDTGEGIPTQHLQRLFERFYRVDRARSREMGGTGLGLAIVKHLVRAHEGEITVESSLGEGSTFAIELPKRKMGG
jgi:two-component system, OmpR family, phosphate regulon sensor histidine kinase PhoR